MIKEQDYFAVIEKYMVWKTKSAKRSNYPMPDELFEEIIFTFNIDPLDHDQFLAWVKDNAVFSKSQADQWEFFLRMLSLAIDMRQKTGPWDPDYSTSAKIRSCFPLL